MNMCARSEYDFGHGLLAPDFFLADKISCWELLKEASNGTIVTDLFTQQHELVKQVNEEVMCFDLAGALTKFFDVGGRTTYIGSPKCIAEPGDFLISRMCPNLQEMGIVETNDLPQVFSSEFLVFRARSSSVSTHSLFALCMSDIVQTILCRGQYGTVQPRFYEFLLGNLPIPACLTGLNGCIQEAVADALEYRKMSRSKYLEAEGLFEKEVKVDDWVVEDALSFVKTKRRIMKSNRWDAEYFRPRYDKLVERLNEYPGEMSLLCDVVKIKKCIEVGSSEYQDEGVPFVRVSNVTPLDITEEKYISEDLYDSLNHHQPEEGEILLTKDASPGIAHCLYGACKQMVPSSGVLRLLNISQKINAEYLAVVLNSRVVREQVSRDVGGSVILHWRPEQVKNVLIPIVPEVLQIEIRQRVRESRSMRRKSDTLLHRAKRVVELGMTQGEGSARTWLRKAMEGDPIHEQAV